MTENKYDFIIVGAGLAGLYAACQASKNFKVALISKSTIEISSSYWAQGGIAAAVSAFDSIQSHIDDTIRTGRRLCNPEAVKILVNDGKECVNELIRLGMLFDKDENGYLALGLEGGHSSRRVLHSGGDATGRELVNFLARLITDNPNISIFENNYVYNLISSGGICYGVLAYNFKTKDSIFFRGSSIIIASGGGSAIFQRTTNPYTSTGEIISCAYNIGAEVESMELIQFHPTAFYSERGETFLISEAVRGEGAYLVNYSGERFLLEKNIEAELSPRDIVSEEIYYEIKKSSRPNVFLDLRHLNKKKIITRFSTIYSEALKHGIDITEELIPVAPAAHYMIGGIKTGVYGETNVKNLYAVGEVASSGVHGANRLASNSLLECLAFAKRAVQHSAENYRVGQFDKIDCNELTIDPIFEKFLLFERIRINRILWTSAGIVRHKNIMTDALDELENIKENYSLSYSEYYVDYIFKMINLAMLILRSALIREESRGCHIREDFPDENPNFEKRIILKK